MPDKHFYFSIGALIGTIFSWLIGRSRIKLQQQNILFRSLYKKDKNWFLFFPILILFIGTWGIIPDIIHALKILPKDITRGDFFNIFFLHSYFEYIEDSNPLINRILNWSGELILFSLAVGTMFYYVSQIKKAIVMHSSKNNSSDNL